MTPDEILLEQLTKIKEELLKKIKLDLSFEDLNNALKSLKKCYDLIEYTKREISSKQS